MTAVPVTAAQRRTSVRRVGLLGMLSLALLTAVVVAAGRGQLDVAPAEVVGSLLHRLGLDLGPMPSHPQGDVTLWTVRFPRVVMAAVAGAALATAGALMQGIFGNPLAEPGVVGVSAGAALAASTVIVFDLALVGTWTVALFAFVGGLVTTILVYFWQLGSLNGSRWEQVGVAAPFMVVGLVAAMAMSRRLDLLALGDRAARHVGVDVERLRMGAIVVVALLTAAAFAFCGIIAFVGLVVPHLVRLLAGPGHRLLVPASALGGALLLVVADLGARTLVAYADLPIGMLTSLVGGPFFFWLIRRARRTSGAWA